LFVVEYKGTRAVLNLDAFCLLSFTGKDKAAAWKAPFRDTFPLRKPFSTCGMIRGGYNEAMETIFDHNPTDEEMVTLFGRSIPREEYLALPLGQESEFGHLYSLYKIRGDTATAGRYLNMIADPAYRRDLSMVDLLD
jgi:hypothetical protein